jgi:hypothetical protein
MIHRRDYTPPKEYVTAEELAELREALQTSQSLLTDKV